MSDKKFILIGRDELLILAALAAAEGVLMMSQVKPKDYGKEKGVREALEKKINELVHVTWNRPRDEEDSKSD